MSREIKFRAWCINEKVWFTAGFSVCESGQQIFDADEFTHNVGEHVKLVQYTGMKDKNGKEIWEGDIVESKTLFKDSIIRAKIIWDEAMGFWKVEEINPVYSEREYLHEVCKGAYETVVVGNIYQNPELIQTVTQ